MPRESDLARPLHNPLWWFAATVVTATLLRAHAAIAFGAPVGPSLTERVLLGFCAACWIARDAGKDVREWPADYTFLFFPLVLPIYLFLTRRWKGVAWFLALTLAYVGFSVLPGLLLNR